MRTTKAVVIFLSLAVMILLTAHSALAGCEVASLDALIALEKNAPKTKYEGPLTVYFHPRADGSGTDMYCFLRLRKGSQLFAFSATIHDVALLDFINNPLVVEEFFSGTVLPGLYPNDCPGTSCPPAVLKSYDQDVNNDDPGANNLMEFYVVDIVIGVQD